MRPRRRSPTRGARGPKAKREGKPLRGTKENKGEGMPNGYVITREVFTANVSFRNNDIVRDS